MRAPLQLVDASTGGVADVGPIRVNELWRRRGAVFLAVRRAGCSLCREHALDLSELVAQLKRSGEIDSRLPVVAVIKQTADEKNIQGVLEFATHYFTAGPTYHDATLATYRMLGRRDGESLRHLSLRMGLYVATAKRVTFTPLGARLARRGIRNQETNDRGDPFVQGGVLIMGPGNMGVHHIYREDTGNMLPVEELRAAMLSIPRPITWP
jgi:hypothetical protein